MASWACPAISEALRSAWVPRSIIAPGTSPIISDSTAAALTSWPEATEPVASPAAPPAICTPTCAATFAAGRVARRTPARPAVAASKAPITPALIMAWRFFSKNSGVRIERSSAAMSLMSTLSSRKMSGSALRYSMLADDRPVVAARPNGPPAMPPAAMIGSAGSSAPSDSAMTWVAMRTGAWPSALTAGPSSVCDWNRASSGDGGEASISRVRLA